MALQAASANSSFGVKPKVTSCTEHGLKIARDGILIGKPEKKCQTCKVVIAQATQKLVLDCQEHGLTISRFGVVVDRRTGEPFETVDNDCDDCKALMELSRKRRATIATRSITRARYDKHALVIESTMSFDVDIDDDEKEDI